MARSRITQSAKTSLHYLKPKSSDGNWYVIMFSWEKDADLVATERFWDLYRYLIPLAPFDPVYATWRKKIEEPIDPKNDLRNDIVRDSLKSLNLIGRRKFVIVIQIISNNSNRVLQKLVSIVNLNASINVEVYPATFVHDLIRILPANTKPPTTGQTHGTKPTPIGKKRSSKGRLRLGK